MADLVHIDSSPLPPGAEIDTIEPAAELKSVQECEMLSRMSELEKIPMTAEMPAIGGGVSPVGVSVYPVIEENNNESHESVERQMTPDPEIFSKEDETGSLEEKKPLVEEPAIEEEESLRSEDKSLKEDLDEFLQKREVKAMTTLFESAIETISKQLQPVTDKMYEKKYPAVDNLLDRLEKASGTKRENLVYGASAFFIIYIFIGTFVQLVANLAGFVYPAWRSIRAVRSPQKDDDTQWLIYWIVFGSFSLIDIYALNMIPFYWLAKVVFLLYLYLPSFKGANVIYEKYIDPTCTKIESFFTPVEKKQN